MLEFKTKNQRSYLLALEEGEPLHASLLDFARREEIVSASISAMGVLRRAIIDLPISSGRSAPIHLEGPLELSALFGVLASEDGELRLEARASLTRLGELGVEHAGGRLLHAEAEYLELMITGFADLGLRRDADDRLGFGTLRGKRGDAAPPKKRARVSAGAQISIEAALEAEPERKTERKPERKTEAASRAQAEPSASSGWGDVIARASEQSLRESIDAAARAREEAAPASGQRSEAAPSLRHVAELAERSRRDDEGSAGALPKRGDYIEHKVFGVCRVDQMQGDGVMVIRLETGRRKQLKVEALEFLEPKTSGRRTIFPVRLKSAR